jgi:hypothetical protein
MLKRFLPSFLASKQSTPPNPQSPLNQSDAPEIGIGFQKRGSIFKEELSDDAYKRFGAVVTLFKHLSYYILIVFASLLVVGGYLDLRLTSQKSEVDELARQLEAFSQTRVQAIEVDKEIAFYKKTLTQRVTLGGKAIAVFGNIGPNIKVGSATLDINKFQLSMEVKTPFEFASLMEAYAKTGVINEISLQSAELIPNRGVFVVTLKGNYK